MKEVLGAVERVQHPQEVGHSLVFGRLAFVVLLAQYAVVRETLPDAFLKEFLRLGVGVRHGVASAVVLELHAEIAAEVARQYASSAARQLDGTRLYALQKLVVGQLRHLVHHAW